MVARRAPSLAIAVALGVLRRAARCSLPMRGSARGGRRCGSRSRRWRATAHEADADGPAAAGRRRGVCRRRGRLRADAALSASGVSLSVDVDGLEGRDGRGRTAEGRVGRECGSRAGRGRHPRHRRRLAGRRSPGRMARRPPRPDAGAAAPAVAIPDPGVPDHERALARRGTTLVGTVKSGALVDVLARGSVLDEAMAPRAPLRDAPSPTRRPLERRSPAAIVAAIVDRRPRRSRRGRPAPAAGSGHVSRDRDLGRQHRHPRRPAARACSGSPDGSAAARCSRRSRRSSRTRVWSATARRSIAPR